MRFLVAIILCTGSSLALGAVEIVTLPTRDGVTQSFLLLQPASMRPRAVAVLLPGGGGDIRLRLEDGKIKFAPNNFLVRSRDEFVQRDVAAALMDAPSDEQSGMNDGFRSGAEHATDVKAVVAEVARRFPGIPVFLVGTSRGTVSAAYAGQALGNGVAGVVLTASVFLANRRSAGLSGFEFGGIKVPVLLVHHRDDACQVTPYSAARELSDRYPLISVSGGRPATSPPCEALSEHGFLGRESETVEAIVNWMFGKPYRKEIN